ncbi:hypothetical protein [Thiohalorhabdus methylotrophus]|uniref:Uncharacterized protein n=1 Tax=Thiohalorhabdus methylotrophus TaxID=3242694 RepID=A0ABV4TZ69_9GAMM
MASYEIIYRYICQIQGKQRSSTVVCGMAKLTLCIAPPGDLGGHGF